MIDEQRKHTIYTTNSLDNIYNSTTRKLFNPLVIFRKFKGKTGEKILT